MAMCGPTSTSVTSRCDPPAGGSRPHAQEPCDPPAGAHRGLLPEPPGRGGAEADTGDGAGIHDPGARRVLPGGRRLRPAARRRVRDRHRVPADRRSATATADAVEKVLADEGFAVLGWRDVPVDGARRASRRATSCRRSARSSSTKDGARRRRARASRLPRAEAHRARDRRARTSRRFERAGRRLQGHAHARPARGVLRRPRATSASRPRSRSCTRGSRPTRSRAGRSRTRTGCSPHNGEINTVQGNENWMRAREGVMRSRRCCRATSSARSRSARPGASDTARFDEALELLQPRGPPAASRDPDDDPGGVGEPRVDGRRSARRSTATTPSLMEPWDGPASIAFTDGTVIGAVLDRNGLRPSRYWVTDDDRVIMASEVGVLDVAPRQIVRKGRLEPGKHVPRRHDAGAHHPRRRDQGRPRGVAPVPASGSTPGSCTSTTCRRSSRSCRSTARGAAAAHVRLHAGGPAADHRADGAQRGRVARLDGHRHAGAGDLRPAADAVRVLQAAVRAGHEPAARRQLRSARHVAQLDDRARGQPARARRPSRAARSCARTPILTNEELAKLRYIDDGEYAVPGFTPFTVYCHYPGRRRRRRVCAWRSTTCARR